MRLGRIFIICIIAIAAASAHGFDFLSSRGIALGQATLLSQPMPSDLLNLPAAGLQPGEWRLETGYNRAFDLRDLDQFMIAGGVRKWQFTFAGGFSQFGRSELYAEQTAKISAAFHRDSLVVGLGGSYTRVAFGGGYETLSATTASAGISFRRNWLLAAVSVDNLTSPSLTESSPAYEPLYSGSLEYRGKRGLSLVGRVTAQHLERPRFSFGQYLGLGQNAALMLGVITAPFQFGGGIELFIKGGQINYGASVHPVLGLSQTISVSYGRSSSRGRNDHDFE